MFDRPGRASGLQRGRLLWAPTLTILVLVTGVVVSTGGFRDPARFALILTGSLALCIVSIRAPERLSRAVLTVPVLSLLALSLLGLISLVWTESDGHSTVLLALTPAAYAGFAVFAACDPLLRKHHTAIASWVAGLAAVAGATGLIGSCLKLDTWTFLLGGHWRPASFLEYPPALALLQLAAMPILARWSAFGGSRGRRIAGASLMLSASVVLLAQSRVVLVLACLLVVAWVVWPERVLGMPRKEAVHPVLAWLVGGSVLAFLTRLMDGWSALAAAAALLLAMPIFLERLRGPVRALVAATSERAGLVIGVASAALLVAVLVLPALDNGPSREGRQAEQGLDHGRVTLWEDSARTVVDRPLLGYGQGSFLKATVEHQEGAVRFAHSQLVESAVELGLLGMALSLLALFGPVAVAWKLRLDPTAWLYIPAVVGFSALALVDWIWQFAGIGAVWALSFGYISALGVSLKSDSC